MQGYEIHHGQTAQHPAMAAAGNAAHAVLDNRLGWQNVARQRAGLLPARPVRGTPPLHALFGAVRAHTGPRVFDGLADYIDTHFAPACWPGLST